jgi:hypothetical protein
MSLLQSVLFVCRWNVREEAPMRDIVSTFGLVAASVVLMFADMPVAALEPEAPAIGDRLELLIDKRLIDRMDGTHLELHKPVLREVVLVHDAPWEGNACGYHVVTRDSDRYRMWYRGTHYDIARK